jgi:enoyl-CoA hydratase/carnithine racemase
VSELETGVDGGVLTVRFARPDSLNALSAAMLDEATDALAAAAADPAVRAVVVTGTGRAFSSGADIGEGDPGDPALIGTLDSGNALVAAIVSLPKPVVAAVNGLAAGIGATIALSCDLVVAKRSSYFLLAFVNIGLMPDGGATAIIPAAVGRVRAARMALLGERLPAADALEWGLVSHVVEDEQFDAEVAALAARLAEGPTAAYARTKEALRQASLGLLAQAHAGERAGQLEMFGTADFAEGIAAFRERRAARFTGR